MESKYEEELLRALLDKGLVSLERAQEALMQHRSSGRPATELLVESGALTEEVLIAFLARAVKTAPIDVTKFTLRRDLAGMLPSGLMREHRVLPMERVGGSLTVAFTNPFDDAAKQAVTKASGLRVKVVVTGPTMLKKRLDELEPVAAAATSAEKANTLEAEVSAVPPAEAVRETAAEPPAVAPAEPAVAESAEAPAPTPAAPETTAPEAAKPVIARVVKPADIHAGIEAVPPAQPAGQAAAKAAEAVSGDFGPERDELLEQALDAAGAAVAERLPGAAAANRGNRRRSGTRKAKG